MVNIFLDFHNKNWVTIKSEGFFFFPENNFVFLENSKGNMGIPYSFPYFFHFSLGLVVSKYTRCDNFWSEASYVLWP